ncbi:phosphoesterase [Sporothrix schenckii 1099-18]|uniref:Phosphoesterase n=1 Tax=Sporothrix schenckii 1099-18 TaxID=1397361 RepID=A0A0F2MIK0_SPOSC|nr:phosphoesterase [Sporothrix schenckii 1099-18]KJR87996.1 phosphoesterase [Sporothrix schenckii 1099-18]
MASGLDSLLYRPRPSEWQLFLRQPCVYVARLLFSWRSVSPQERTADGVSVVCISDTHNHQPRLPDGDVLIHAGDLTQSGSFIELEETLAWLRRQTHAVKIVVAGNHDVLLDEVKRGQREEDERQHRALDWGDIVYLENDETTVTCPNGRRLRVYGSPLSPRHGNWAFQYSRAHDVWAQQTPPISPGIDVLITHSPPHAHLDRQLGCVHLLRTIWRVRPRLHVFGHVHDGAGTEWVQFDALQSAYEKTVLDNGYLRNMLNLGQVFVLFVWLRIWPASETTKCLLVNAATVGGIRDDTLRQPIQVLL